MTTLAGDVTGPAGSNVVSTIGGQTVGTAAFQAASAFDAAGSAATAASAAAAAQSTANSASTAAAAAATNLTALPKLQVEQIVSSNGAPPYGQYGGGANYNRLETNGTVRLGGAPCSALRAAHNHGWYNQANAAGEATMGNSLVARTCIASLAALPGNTVTTTSTFSAGTYNGADAGLIESGAALVLSDPYQNSYAAYADVLVKTCLDAPDFNCNLPTRPYPRYNAPIAADNGILSSDQVQDTQIYSTTSALATPSGGTSYNQSGISFLIGKFKTPQVAIVAQADSYGEGIGDVSDGYNLGYIERGLWNSGQPFPLVNNSRGSQCLFEMETSPRQRAVWKYATDIYAALGRNDVFQNNNYGVGRTTTQQQNDCLKWWADMKATLGCTGKPLRITQSLIAPYSLSNFQLTVAGAVLNGGTGYPASQSNLILTISGGTLATGGATPNTPSQISVTTNSSGVVTAINSIVTQGSYVCTSTLPGGGSEFNNLNLTVATTSPSSGSGMTFSGSFNGWFNVADQIAQPGWSGGAASQRAIMNAFYVTSLANGLIDAIFDPCTGLWEYSTNTSSPYYGFWAVNGTANFMAYDGTHPSQYGHAQAGLRLLAQYQGYGGLP